MFTSIAMKRHAYHPLPKVRVHCAWDSFLVMQPIACASVTLSFLLLPVGIGAWGPSTNPDPLATAIAVISFVSLTKESCAASLAGSLVSLQVG